MSIGKTGATKISSGIIDYILRKQKESEKQPRIIGGNVTGKTKKEIKDEFKDQEKLNSRVKNTTVHFIVSYAANEQISDEDAADYAEELMDMLAFSENPFIVVRHYDKETRAVDPYAHLHIGASRVKNDGMLVSEWELAERFIEAVKTADRKFGFKSVEYVKGEKSVSSERNIKKDEYQMMSRKSKLSILEEFKDCAEKSLSEKKDLRGFVEDVRAAGFEVSPNVAEENGEMRGFAFSKDGIIFTAKKAGERFKWANLARELDYQPERDAKFLLALKAEFAAKKEAEKILTVQIKEQEKSQEKSQIEKQARNQTQVKKQPQTKQQAQIKEEPQNQILIKSEESNNPKTQDIQLAAEENYQTQIEIAEVKANEATNKRSTVNQPATARISASTGSDGDEQSLQTGNGGGSRSLAESGGNSDGENSIERKSRVSVDTQTKLPAKSVEVDETNRIESIPFIQKTEIIGGESAPVRDDRTDNQATRSREKAGEHSSDKFAANQRDEKLGANHHAENERGFEGGAKRGGESVETSRSSKHGNGLTRQANRSRETKNGNGGEEISGIPNLGGTDESADQRGLEHQGFARSRTSNQDQRRAKSGESAFRISDDRFEKSDRRDSAPQKRSGEGNRILEEFDGQKSPLVQGSELDNNSGTIHRDDGFDNQLLPTKLRTDGEHKPGKKEECGVIEFDGSLLRGQNEINERLESNHANTAANLSRGGEFLQNESSGTDKTDRAKRESNRQGSKGREAETAAQIVNIKRYGGQLHPQIVTNWISIIKQTDAPKFLDEIVRSQTAEEKAKVDEQLDRQIAVVAERLKLPVPVPKSPPDSEKLGQTLTKIEVANFERETGESLGDKIFEKLVEQNKERAGQSLSDSEIQSGGNFNHSTVERQFSSPFEARAFVALLDPESAGYDRNLIDQTRADVELNLAAARETATLIQIAYGGQSGVFTAPLKNDLAERIYYAPSPTTEIYDYTKQLDWQKATEMFAPLVKEVGDDRRVAIGAPTSDQERNKMLAEFITRQMTEAAQAQDQSITKYFQYEIAQRLLKLNNVEVTPYQTQMVAAYSDQDLETPAFKRQLEASAYLMTKYEDDKKIEFAEQVKEIIQADNKEREDKQIEHEKMVEEQVLSM